MVGRYNPQHEPASKSKIEVNAAVFAARHSTRQVDTNIERDPSVVITLQLV
jgi:hypothetical protein